MVQAKDGSTTQVSCRIPKEISDALTQKAQEQERSLSWVVSKILQKWYEEEQKKK